MKLSIKKLKVAHWVGITPNACGLYEHAKDQIRAERLAGIDAQAIDYRIVDNKEVAGEIKADNWLTSVSLDWLKDADINVIHSGILEREKSKRPNILILHGRPEYAFQLALLRGNSHYQEYNSYKWDERYSFVTFWPEHQFTWSMVFPQHKMHYVPAFIDTDRFNPTGDIIGLTEKGSFNILLADVWREDVTPYNVSLAVAQFIKTYCPDARMHIIGLHHFSKSAVQGHLGMLKDNNVLGDCGSMIPNTEKMYRACDLMASPQVIATRSIREAMSCGCMVVAGQGATYTDYTANPMDISGFCEAIKRAYDFWKINNNTIRIKMHEKACKLFNLKSGGENFKTLYEAILKEKQK
jgi:glycosyltransferase involved in cell wall biosynthesis